MYCSELSTNPFNAEQNLPEYEIFARLPCGLIVINAQGLIVWFNAAAEDLLGKGLEGAVWLDVIKKAFSPRADDGHEVSLVDGRRVSVAISSLDSLPGELVTLTDLTTTRDYENAKANQRRLAAIGRMTAQLAHQIRTPLSSAMIYTEHLINHGFEQNRSDKWIARIQECHLSIEKQIQDLLLFARGDTLELTPVNLQEFGTKLTERATSLVNASLTILHVDNHLPPLDYPLHEESLMGAVLNLVSNALQAGASYITITLRYIKNDVFLILIKDNGSGMSEDVKAQAFSPFFTTKAQGTGLGLAVVNAVVKAHEGAIILDSSPGTGCCVTINLPG
ncbi:MAG: ATP-binding protein [Legionella sp.]|nr:ATP-binding protein [Legionella sp.]